MFLIRRLVWFTTGATAGFGGAMWIRRWVLRRVERLMSPQVSEVSAQVGQSAQRAGRSVRRAVAEGRAAARRREAELREELRPGPGTRLIDQGGRSSPVG